METTYIGWLVGIVGICIIFYLSSIESLEKSDITAITCVGWAIYILFSKGGLQWHLRQ
jgi:hypothetical protein